MVAKDGPPQPAVGTPAHTAEYVTHYQGLVKMIDANSGKGFLNVDQGHPAQLFPDKYHEKTQDLRRRCSRPMAKTTYETVSRVIDGDTFETHDCETDVRLASVNAPELHQSGGPEAKAELKRLVEGRVVAIRTDGYGFYGRRVAQVWCDGVDVNHHMRLYVQNLRRY